MPPNKRTTRKPTISNDEMLQAMISSFKIEGITISMEEARQLLQKAKLSLGKQNG